MSSFMLAFTLLMIIAPVVAAGCVPLRPEAGGDAVLARKRFGRLVIATIVALVIFAICYAFLREWAAFAWPLFFPLWFGFAMPVLTAKNPDTVHLHAGGQSTAGPRVRSASLVNRERVNPVRTPHWIIVWAIAIVGVVTVIVGLARTTDPIDGWRLFGPIITIGLWLPMLALLPLFLRTMLREPEPMNAAGSPELAAAYDRHRRFKVWGMWWLFGIAMNVLMCGTAALSAWLGNLPTLGILGAVGGTTIGIAGGVFGTAASIHRIRIARLLRELQSEEAAAVGGLE